MHERTNKEVKMSPLLIVIIIIILFGLGGGGGYAWNNGNRQWGGAGRL